MRTLVALVLLLALALAMALSFDLGPSLRGRAERAASDYLQRDVRIGKLSIRLLPGRFVVEDLVIGGLRPADTPFLTARRIDVAMPWWTAFNHQILFRGIHMTGWKMTVEVFEDGRHNFPRFTRETQTQGPKKWTTTLQYVTASDGEFTFRDYGAPWSTIARNLNVTVYRSGDEYRGHAAFHNGLVSIMQYVPMRADMATMFRIDGGKVHLYRIDLVSDGAKSVINGDVDLGHWPEQTYNVASHLQFKRMREIFFSGEHFTLFGEGDFNGVFHLFKGGRELKGTFSSPVAGVNDYRFPNLRGTVVWLPNLLDVPQATAGAFGGTSQFSYRMWKPAPEGDWLARFDARYQNVDLAKYTDFLGTRGIRVAGTATGHHLMEWPSGHFTALLHGEGDATIAPPPGTVLRERALSVEDVAAAKAHGVDVGPFNPELSVGYVPMGGHLVYQYTPEWITLDPGWISTPSTFVAFEGRTSWLERSNIAFHATSSDWQASDRILAGVLTAFGSPTTAVPMYGYGEFDGVMLNAFRDPRIVGDFVGGALTAWNVNWGSGRAKVAIENSYVDVTDAVIQDAVPDALGGGTSEMRVDGRFSLGYPRKDHGEEIDARIFMTRRPLKDLRTAFELYDYPVDGLTSGEYHLQGIYTGPNGFGRLQIDEGVAYGEPFERATAGLRFEGTGVRLDGIEIAKGNGRVTGAAWVGWDGTYSFNADGRRLAVESLTSLAFPTAPLSGLMQFTASGNATFEVPRYDVRARIEDLYAGAEGIGQVTGHLAIRGKLLTIELEGASPRLAVSGSGQIALTPEADAELTFRFNDTSLDPYARTFVPKLSPFATAVVSGTIRVAGELAFPEHLLVDATVDELNAKLFDYHVHNQGPLKLAFDQNVIRATQLRLAGEGTQLEVGGVRPGESAMIDLTADRIAVRVTGDANLGLLQAFLPDVRSSGVATLVADVRGSIESPVFSGSARIADGRIREFALPHSLENINGTVAFDAKGIRLDRLTAKLGGGDVRFGGRVALKGYLPDTLDLTAVGQQMRLRYPEGFVSVADADLTLRGTVTAPVLGGTVTVRSATWSRRFDPGEAAFGLGVGGRTTAPVAATAAAPAFPLRFDVRIVAPSTLRVDNNVAQIVSSADLHLLGTYERPVLSGRADVVRGDLMWAGNRYRVTRGTIDFTNPVAIEPFFDFEAETRVRVPGQNYVVTIALSGTPVKPILSMSSDPPLPEVEIVSLLLGESGTNTGSAELRALTESQKYGSEIVASAAGQLLVTTLSSPVSAGVEKAVGIDTVQITPLLGDISSIQTLNPAARVTIGKRISSRAYITYSRAVGASHQDQLILLEYDASDRISWILSRNEDGTFAVDVRVRHTF